MASTVSALKLDVLKDGIAVVTFDQPGTRANTLGQGVLADLETVLHDLEGRSDVRGLIFQSGKPGMFIAGADLKELGSAEGNPDLTRKFVERGLGVVARFENLPYPTIAMIDGACMGGGLELALGFDYRLTGTNPKAELAFPEV